MKILREKKNTYNYKYILRIISLTKIDKQFKSLIWSTRKVGNKKFNDGGRFGTFHLL